MKPRCLELGARDIEEKCVISKVNEESDKLAVPDFNAQILRQAVRKVTVVALKVIKYVQK